MTQPEPDDTQPADETDPAPPDDSAGKDSDANSEAARYRRRLRDTETERDGLRGRIEQLQRADVERRVTGQLAVPGDLFQFGLPLDQVLDDDGAVDDAAVQAAVRDLLAKRPGLSATAPPRKGPTVTGHTAASTAPANGWADLLRNTTPNSR